MPLLKRVKERKFVFSRSRRSCPLPDIQRSAQRCNMYASEFAPNSRESAQITLDLKAGKIPVRFTANSENAGRDRADGQVFGEMRQRDPEFGVTFPREEVAGVIGIGV